MRPLKDILLYHIQAIKSGFASDIFTSNQLIHCYSRHARLREAQKLFDEMPDRNVFSWNAIISAYIKGHNLTHAQTLFRFASQRDLVTYNSMLSGYVGNDGYETEALNLFTEMQSARERIRMDEVTLTTMLNLTAKLCVVCYGSQIHSYMAKTANDLSAFAVSSLIDMYSKCGCFQDAYNIFNHSGCAVDLVSKNAMVAACCREGQLDVALNLFWEQPDLNDCVSWNTLISGYSQNGYEDKSLALFVQMGENGVRWNEHTFASILSSCSGLKSLKLGKAVHAWVLKDGLITNQFISCGIVDVYCKCCNIRYAELVHADIGIRNSFAITSLIVAYSSQGNMVEARRLFDSLEEKNSVVWTALFSGYVKSQQCESVFNLLRELKTREAMVPDALINVSVLGACAIQAALGPGKQIHAYILRAETEINEKLMSALVDMYSKCGNIIYAEKVFQLYNNKDSVLYNVMIAGYVHHGLINEAIQLFHDMLERSIRPDVVTFVALLSGCRHLGLVELGEKIFGVMEDHNILPEINHYACMVDMYGRANQIEKALAFMKKIPTEIDAVIWGAFLDACQRSGNTAFAREAGKKLLETEADNGARYVQLANAYAAEGNWDEMGKIRKRMRENEVKKLTGCSWIYMENGVHIFTSGDRSHSKVDSVYSTLDSLTEELYVTSREWKNLPEISREFS
ncbi:Pentatricopeptide repeat-containing protein [Quillaja saponaria]|uniref:Pentatricopeptide repeat-containing protein n=1 Tax=Quillaja saponaria TaxID=32244 RepID=A0AAD7M0D5_QUISA|nr:Pentatricopeptide repeat-containing protein [Quillaja saponaria]KAJ7967352.1 Pentatricopeptide repeat-containing protein [Quillaja saponaria]